MADRLHELLAFALDLYRAPLKNLRFVEANRPLPVGLDALLEALNKGADTEIWKAMGQQLEASPDELRSAGFFLVKRLLFADGADYYRVLGLEPDSDIARIREHYRLLMALFHPDRIHQRDEWTEQYAPKINEAYSTFKHSDRKQAYDRTLELHEDPWGDEVPPPGGSENLISEPQGTSEFEPLDLARNVEHEFRREPERERMFVVTVVVLLAAVVGLGILLRHGSVSNVTAETSIGAELGTPLTPSDTIRQAQAGQSALATERTDPAPVEITTHAGSGHIERANPKLAADARLLVAATPPEPGVQSRGETANTAGDPGAASTLTESPAIAIPKTPAVLQESEPQRVAKAPQIGAENLRPSATSLGTYPSAAADDSSKVTMASADAKMVSRPVNATAPAARRSFIDQRDIDLLISRFIQAYEAGDTEKFMRLFNYRVKTNKAVGRDAIARQYGKLFRTTEHRSLVVKDLKWVPKGADTARISFFAAIEVEPNGYFTGKDYLGGVDLFVRMDGRRLTILEFLHQVAKK